MYKDRLRKWCISKNVKSSDIHTIITKDKKLLHQDQSQDSSHPEFYVVGGRLIRTDRVRQAMQRRAASARRALRSDVQGRITDQHAATIVTWNAKSPARHDIHFVTPMSIHMTAPDELRMQEAIVSYSRNYIIGSFDSPSAHLFELKMDGPVQRWRMVFEETIANFSLVTGIDQLAFKSLNDAFELIQPSLVDRDPQFTLVLMQMLGLCVWSNKPDISRTLLRYIYELGNTVLGPLHPITSMCKGLQTADMEMTRHLCRPVVEATWQLFRRYLYPFKLDSFIHVTAIYGDLMDSLDLFEETESFMRKALDLLDRETVPVENYIQLELNLIVALRRVNKFPEAFRRLARIRQTLAEHRSRLMLQSEEKAVDLIYAALRTSGQCECTGGDLERGRVFFRQAFELLQEKKGKHSPRTTGALRDLIRWSDPKEELMNDLEDRLAKFKLETDGFL